MKDPLPLRNDNDVLYAHFLGIGEGDCLLLEIPASKKYINVLIDIGTGSVPILTERLRDLGISQIDYAILTHPHKDHCSGFAELLSQAENESLNIWTSKCFPDPPTPEFASLISNFSDRMHFPEAGEPIEDLPITILAPTEDFYPQFKQTFANKLSPRIPAIYSNIPSSVVEAGVVIRNMRKDKNESFINNMSLVLQIAYGGVTILLPGDIWGSQWDQLPADIISHTNILKVSHHGSDFATPHSLIGKMNPQYAVCSKYGNVLRNEASLTLKAMQVEECYYVGYTQSDARFAGRLSCTLAIKPNTRGQHSIIIPLIYNRNQLNEDQIDLFIRPIEEDIIQKGEQQTA